MDPSTPGKGTKFQVTIANVLTDVPGIVEVTPPSPKQSARIDTTDIADNSTRKSPSMVVDWQDAKVKMMWNPANTVHQHLLDIALAGTKEAMTVVWADAGACSSAFTAYLEDFPFAALKNDVVQEIDFTVVIDGACTITP